jgi:hypothetical protein
MKIIPAIRISLAFGFVLGSIPVVNEHLHWNLWFIIPVSGMLFGMATGFLQFWSCYALNQQITRAHLLGILPLAGLLGYALVDYGTFLTTTVHLKDVQNLPEGDYKLSDLITFAGYMAWRLGSSTIKADMDKPSLSLEALERYCHTLSILPVRCSGPSGRYSFSLRVIPIAVAARCLKPEKRNTRVSLVMMKR